LFAKQAQRNPKVRVVDELSRESDVARQLGDYILTLLSAQPIAFPERERVISGGPLLDLGGNLLHGARLQIGRQLLVIPGGGRIRRQKHHVWQVISRREIRRLEIHDRGNKHDAVESNATTDQVS